jgi:Tfp pilus assembly protein PilN
MRAVNLIPPEARGGRAGLRTGPLSYVVIGALVAVLAGVSLTVLTSKQISDRKSEVAALEQERDAAQTKLDSLRPFAEFASMQQQRTATVTSLAQSRFDWERVMRELALVLPDDVWLLQLEGTVSPDVQLDSGVDIAIRGSSVPGPALELVGCTVSQEAVGRLAAALHDIDGVTRVAVFKSERPDLSSGDTATGGAADTAASGSEDDCRTRDFITRFEIVVAFDAVPAPEVPAPPPLPGSPSSGEEVETPEQAAAQESVQEGVAEGQETANAVPGT